MMTKSTLVQLWRQDNGEQKNFLRRVFATLLLSNQILRPEIVWNSIWEYLSDDILQRQRNMLQFQGIYNYFYYYIF